jgi:hypothetical protein
MTRAFLGALLVTLLLAGLAAATTLRRMTLDDVAGQSREIVAGTVTDVTCVPGTDGRGMIYTDVVFDSLDVWKGNVSASTATYRFAGGKIGDRQLTVAGMPLFEKGRRYVLFANPDSDAICPLVGWMQGRYRIVRDARTGAEHVRDSDGHAVYGFASGLPVHEPTKERPRPLTVLELQVEVVRALERSERPVAQPETAPQDLKRDQPPAADAPKRGDAR